MSILFRRFLARLFNYGFLYFTLVLTTLILPIDLDNHHYRWLAIIIPLVWMPIEMLLLHLFGTTIGNTLVGLSFSPLSWKESFKRALFLKKSLDMTVTKMSLKRSLIVALITCSAALAPFFAGKVSKAALDHQKQAVQSGWIEYIPGNGKFQVQFPKKPQEMEQTFDIPDADSVRIKEFKAEHKEAQFSVSYLDFPKKWRLFSSTTLLKGAMNVILEHLPTARLIDKKLIKHKNYPAMDFRIQEGANLIEGRLILVGNTLYKLWVVYPNTRAVHAEHDIFVSSFELTQ